MCDTLVILAYIIVFLVLFIIIKFYYDKYVYHKFNKRYTSCSVHDTECESEKYNEYDYIIIGLGTAGSVMTRRLAEYNPHARILVLERGANESNSSVVYNVSNGATAAYTVPYSETLPNVATSLPAAVTPPITVATMTGGASSHNYALVIFGSMNYYLSQYANLSQEEVIRMWNKINTTVNTTTLPTSINVWDKFWSFLGYTLASYGNWYKLYITGVHSLNTLLNVGPLRASDTFSKNMTTAMNVNNSVPLLEDYNNVDYPIGSCVNNTLFINSETGLRNSADIAYLTDEFLHCHSGITILTDAIVSHVDRHSDGRAISVSYTCLGSQCDRQARLKCDGKVIMCAGAIYSPYLLMKSGIIFEALMINHYGTTLVFKMPSCEVGSFSSGPLAFINENLISGYEPHNYYNQIRRDYQIVVGGSTLLNYALVPGGRAEEGWNYISMLLWFLHPRVRGTVTLPEVDTGKPVVDFPMFSDGGLSDPDSDMSHIYVGMLYMKSVYDRLKSNAYCNAELIFPPENDFLPGNETLLTQDIKTGVTMTDHYSATCSSIIRPVCDHNALSLYEADNIYIADTSSFVDISDGNCEFPVLFRAEYLAISLSNNFYTLSK